MRFAYPHLLWLIPVMLIIAGLLYAWARRIRKARLEQLCALPRLPNLLRAVNPRARPWKFALLCASLVFLCVVLARPIVGPHDQSGERKGVDFYVLLDVSKSMWADDVAPTRLEAAVSSLKEWLNVSRGDRVGLILMAGESFVQAPITYDFTALAGVLDQSGPGSISRGGTDMAKGIETAITAFEKTDVEDRILVIVSDGENLDGNPVEAASRARRDHNITIHTLGIGTDEGGEVPQYHPDTEYDWQKGRRVRNQFGLNVVSKLDERMLRSVANAGGGAYVAYTPGVNPWLELYAQELAVLQQRDESIDLNDYTELFQLPLFLTIVLLAAELFIKTRRKTPPAHRNMVTLPPRQQQRALNQIERGGKRNSGRSVSTTAAGLIVVGLMVFAPASDALPPEELRLMLEDGQLEEAAELLREATRQGTADVYAVYNYGIVAYQSGDYEEAIYAFSTALGEKNADIQAKALVQLGNAHYRWGQELMSQRNRAGAATAWEQASRYYDKAESLQRTRVTKNNRSVATEAAFVQLEKLGMESQAQGIAHQQIRQQIRLLKLSISYLERAVELQPEAEPAQAELVESRELLARLLREEAANLAEQAQEAHEQDKHRNRDRANQTADAYYEEARQLTPEDASLQEEHEAFREQVAGQHTEDAREQYEQAMAEHEQTQSGRSRALLHKESESALKKLDQAMAYDEDHAEAQALQEDISQMLEQDYLDLAQSHESRGDDFAERKQAQNAAGYYQRALDHYQKTLEHNPENTEALNGAESAREKLAEQLVAAGLHEMKQSGFESVEDIQTAAEAKTVNDWRQAVGHLEKASQNFDQSSLLTDENTRALELREQASEMLAAARTQLNDTIEAQQQGQPAQADDESSQQAPPDESDMSHEAGRELQTVQLDPTRRGNFQDRDRDQPLRDW